MMMTALLCLLFFAGFIALRSHVQALAFLGIGAGLQLLGSAIPATGDASDGITTTLLVCLFSVLGYIAWRSSRRALTDAPFGKQRLLIFGGWAANGVIATFILWLTGMITL